MVEVEHDLVYCVSLMKGPRLNKVPDVTSDDGRMRKLFARTNVAQKCINHETALSILQSAATDIKTFQPDEGDELLNRFIKCTSFLP